MKAPEKIFLQKFDNNAIICLNKYNIHEEWTETPCCGRTATNIEYTRTDAFIEKAVCFLNDKLSDRVEIGLGTSIVGKQEFIDDFRKHMKG